MPEFVLCVTTTNRKSIADKLARILVHSKLSACVNIVENIKSVYSWRGKVVRDREYLVIIKTRKSRIKKVQGVILENHNYQLPEFIWFKIGGASTEFLKWLVENTR
ncbi:MAG: divalent-cation tolerance protein CutA [Candidatus Omnitrophota bacterium]|nr:MAG: divalent-cation tolerance protein CutA [Candidatus Omnitrophota bacterium]